MQKIAVRCNTKEEWTSAIKKANKGHAPWCDINEAYPTDFRNGRQACIDISRNGWDFIDRYENQGYTIISAQEYLGGIMEDNDFKIPPEPYKGCFEDIFKAGGCENWTSEVRIECGGTSCQDCILSNSNINELRKYLSKENNMKENNINKNVLEVFGDLSAKEVVIIDRHFTDEMLKVIMMNNHKEEIRRACEEAEEKLNSDTEMAIGA